MDILNGVPQLAELLVLQKLFGQGIFQLVGAGNGLCEVVDHHAVREPLRQVINRPQDPRIRRRQVRGHGQLEHPALGGKLPGKNIFLPGLDAIICVLVVEYGHLEVGKAVVGQDFVNHQSLADGGGLEFFQDVSLDDAGFPLLAVGGHNGGGVVDIAAGIKAEKVGNRSDPQLFIQGGPFGPHVF